MSYVFPPPVLVPFSSVQVSSRTYHRSIQMSSSSGTLLERDWIEATWLPTVLSLLVDIPHCCPIVQNLVMDVSVDWVLKVLPSQY